MMHLDEKTGLLYINDVPFTLDHLKKLRKLFKYSKKTSFYQFKHAVIITNTAVNPIQTVTVDEYLINDIFKLYDIKKIARDKQFEM